MKILIISVVAFLCTGPLWAKKECACGDYATGYHHYHVGDGTGCCSGAVLENEPAWTATYAQETDGGWQLIDSEFGRPDDLQDECCDES